MKRTSLFAIMAIAALLVPVVAPVFATGPTQPPLDPTTLYVGTIAWGPRRADPVRAYDTASGELLFNVYDTLISMGEDVTNPLYPDISWDVEEQYWEFSPNLAINVPDRQTVTCVEHLVDFHWEIVIRPQEPVPYPLPIDQVLAVWWEDAIIGHDPYNKYHANAFIDNDDTVLSPSDLLQLNAYWWPSHTMLKECEWWHVLQVEHDETGITLLHLEWVPKPDAEFPVCTWWTMEGHPDRLYHINNWVDNNPDGVFGPVDVVYKKEHQMVTVTWEKIGERTHLLPVTKRTYQVVSWDPATGTLTDQYFYYDFIIRTDPVIYFYDKDGNVVGTFDIYDVEYSIKRGLVQDQYGSPMWMFYKPFFDQMNSDFWDTGDPADAIALSYLIKDTIEVFPETNTVRFYLGIAFPDKAFKQIMSQTWASILDKDWCIGKGCWDGELFSDDGRYTGSTAGNDIPDWFESWRHCAASPIQAIKPENYAGTGPYRVIVASAAQNLVVLQRNPNYWRGWPAPDRKAYLEYVDIEYIADWTTRKIAFDACQLDVCAVPRANMLELLDPADKARMTTLNPAIVTIKNIQPVLAMDAEFFTFTVAPTSPALWSGQFPTGVPPDFFNNTHTRRAFAYAFDHGKYIKEVWLEEAICRETPLIYGLVPDYYTKSPDPPWTYDKNIDKVIEELQKAYFVQGTENKSVWDWGGFKISIYYNSGNLPRQLACEYIKATFDYINSVYGKNFIIDIQGPDWATYLDMMENFEMPLYSIGWLADFADADNWVRPFMHSYGDFSYFQNYTAWNGWTTPGPRTGLHKDLLIDIAVKTPDGPQRATYYADLDDIYIKDCPSFPIIQASGRRWQKYWVKGWYYNGLYPSQYYYKMYKEQTCWANVIGAPGPTNPHMLPDDVCNMRDIGYISKHFGATAPDPAREPPYDPKWAPGVYGCLGADVYGDRRVDMRDIGLACKHFGHTTQP